MNMTNISKPVAANNSDFVIGDMVVFKYNYQPHHLMIIEAVLDGGRYVGVDSYRQAFPAKDFRHATPVEIQLKRRVNKSVEISEMADDAHIENHISPLCKTESQPVLIVERDNQIIERLKAENVVLQAKVDELQAENKILNQAASTHLKNQMHFKKLYDALAEQLYPYAIDLEEPVDGGVNTPKEYVDGYNRARECAHYNLLEMMESNEEYIRAQCGMLGGGGEA